MLLGKVKTLIMNAKKLPAKLQELSKYYDVDIDKDFASELIPVIKLVILNTDIKVKIAKGELNFFENWYIEHCAKKDVSTSLSQKIMDKATTRVRQKLIKLLEVLEDIVDEDSDAWNKKWGIESYHKLKYDKVKSTQLSGYVLKVKPEFKQKQKENDKIRSRNIKRREKCLKWRDSHIKFYKKVLKIVK